MSSPLSRSRQVAAAATLVLALAACSPSLNWREVRGADAPYSVLLPAKPASHSRTVALGDLKVEMSMTAAEVDDMNFAVASARIDDASKRETALATMQRAMLRNIGAEQHSEKKVVLDGGVPATEIEASGRAARNGRTLLLRARFAIHGERVYQAVAIGPKDQLTPEASDTFLSSFKLR